MVKRAAVFTWKIFYHSKLTVLFASSLVPTIATFDLSSRYDFVACVNFEVVKLKFDKRIFLNF